MSPPSSRERGLTAPPGNTGDRRGAGAGAGPVIRLRLTAWQSPARGPASGAVGGRRVFTVGELPPHPRLTCCWSWCTHVCGHPSSPGGPVTAAWRGTAHRPSARGARTPRRCPGPSRGCFHRDPRKPPSATLPTPCSGPSPTRFPPWQWRGWVSCGLGSRTRKGYGPGSLRGKTHSSVGGRLCPQPDSRRVGGGKPSAAANLRPSLATYCQGRAGRATPHPPTKSAVGLGTSGDIAGTGTSAAQRVWLSVMQEFLPGHPAESAGARIQTQLVSLRLGFRAVGT